jgi:hypothetical protein
MATYAKRWASEHEKAKTGLSWKIWSCEGAALTCRIRSKKGKLQAMKAYRGRSGRPIHS